MSVEPAPNRLPKLHNWVLTYGDLVSLLLVFFVLFYVLSYDPPRAPQRRDTVTVGRRDVMENLAITRHAGFPTAWSPLGRVRYRRDPEGFPPAELAHVETSLLPSLRASSADVIVIACDPTEPTSNVASASGRPWRAARLLRAYLLARGLDPSRSIFSFVCPAPWPFPVLGAERPTRPEEIELRIYLAPHAVEIANGAPEPRRPPKASD